MTSLRLDKEIENRLATSGKSYGKNQNVLYP